ncbi:MAG TPA: hypothetical protein DC038_05020, partial [Clostridiales bacterium]|nr:hypothetical protein [Clostridiales bacterium]
MVINGSIQKNKNNETKILRKGGETMQKPKMFNRVICFVIAMLMLMPSMPASYVFGDTSNLDYIAEDLNEELESELKSEETDTEKEIDEPSAEESKKEESEESETVVLEEPEADAIEILYTISYLIEGTDEQVPDLAPVTGKGKAGDVVIISSPEIAGYKVLDNQPTTLELTEEIEDVVIYYEKLPVESISLLYKIIYKIDGTDETVPGLISVEGEGKAGDIIEVPHPEIEGFRVSGNQPNTLELAEDGGNEVIVYYVPVINEAVTLKINHIILLDEYEEIADTDLLEGLNIGTIIAGKDLVKEELLTEGFEFLYSDPEELEVNEDTEISVYYQESMGENPDNLDEPEYVDAPEIYFPKALRLRNSLLSGSIEWPNQGALHINKVAEPISGISNQWKVTLTLQGKDLTTTSDIVLVIDRSGSMSGSKLTSAKNAAKQFVNTLLYDGNTSTRIAVVSFAGGVAVNSDFKGSNEKQALINAI